MKCDRKSILTRNPTYRQRRNGGRSVNLCWRSRTNELNRTRPSSGRQKCLVSKTERLHGLRPGQPKQLQRWRLCHQTR
jgi:hypothetical protein